MKTSTLPSGGGHNGTRQKYDTSSTYYSSQER
jgi:hypothetical protein